ncbi:hypothetical protein [Nonomuraea sp. NPDC005650]
MVLPLTPWRRDRAVAALSQLITAWWDEHLHAIDDRSDDAAQDVAEGR